VIRARELGLKVGETPVHFKSNDNRGSFVKPKAILEFTSNLLRYRFSPKQRALDTVRSHSPRDTNC